MLPRLIGQFEDLCRRLTAAVRDGDEAEVLKTDEALRPVLDAIFAFEASTRVEIDRQIAFFAELAVRYAEDDESVRRYTGMMRALFRRYLDGAGQPSGVRPVAQAAGFADGYDASIQDLLLDSVPERVAVFSRDYRYIYCNRKNAAFHNAHPSDFIGRHLADVIGKDVFEARARHKLDQCFEGATVNYVYEIMAANGQHFRVDCRMTPLTGPGGLVAGAVVVLDMEPLFARVR